MTLLSIALIIVGILGVAFQLKKEKRYEGVSNLVLLTVIGATLMFKVDTNGQKLLYALLAIAAINFIFSRFGSFRKPLIRSVLPIVSTILFFVLFKNESFEFMGAQFAVYNKFIVLSSVLALLGIDLAVLLFRLLGGLINSGQEKFVRSLLLFFVGASAFLASFQTGPVGIFVIAAIYFSSSFFREKERGFAGQALLVLSILGFISSLGDGNLAIDKPDVIFGLFTGGFAALFLHNQIKTRNNWFSSILSHLLILSLTGLLLMLHVVYANMGGIDAYSSLIIGFTIVSMALGNGYISLSVLPLSLALTIMIAPVLVNEEQDQFESMFEGFTEIEGEPIVDTLTSDTKVVKADTLNSVEAQDENAEKIVNSEEVNEFLFAPYAGKYSFGSDNSKVMFELGEDGETKGAFKKLSGSVTIKDGPEGWNLKVELDMKHFTTFDDMRDDHLSGEEYFHVEKYPKMRYTANKLVRSGNQWYFDGEFSMLGATKRLKVSVKPSKKDGKTYIMGSGVIDRREFGMTPSETEGNIVSFNYIAEIK